MKKFNKILIIALVVAIIASMSILLVGCKKKPTEPEDPVPTTYVTMDVNPSVELVLDQNNVVLDVVSANQDAAVMLYNQDNIVGADVSVASKNIINAAIDLKYVSKEDSKNVQINVSSSDTAKVDAVFTETSASIKAELDLAGIQAKVEKGVDYMLEKELAVVKENKAGVKGYDDTLTVSKYRLVKRAMLANVTLSMDETVVMSEAELIKQIDYAKDQVKNAYDKTTALAMKVAQNAYDKAVDEILEAQYTAVYAKGLLPGNDLLVSKAVNKSSLVAQYKALDIATNTFEFTVNTVRKAIDEIRIPVEPVKAALKEAGLSDEEVNKLDKVAENKKGKKVITKESMEAFINEAYRNMTEEERAAFDGKYNSTIKVQVNEYQAQVDSAISLSADGLKAAIKSEELGLDINVDAKFTIYSIDTIITKLHEATDKKFDEIVENLTDEGKALVKEKQDAKQAEIDKYTKEFEDAVKEANTKAEAAVKKALEARKIEFNLDIEIK